MLCRIFTTQRVCCCVFIFLSCLRISLTNDHLSDDKPHREKTGKIEGDIILGGIFRISQKEERAGQCGETVEIEVGIQRAEAMLYAIQEVNKDPDLLPNVTLGAEIRDSCSQDTVALDESLKFILDSLSLQTPARAAGGCVRNVTKDVVGVVGASRSSISIEVAKLLRLFKVPQVSYASTSAELSNNRKYSYFARTVPPDTQQALAMLDVIREFNWTSVFTINSAGSYGEKGIEEFKKYAKNYSVCVVSSEQVTDDYSRNEYENIVDRFFQSKLSSTTNVVVLFMKDNHVKELLQAFVRKEWLNVTWIASDEWGTRQDVVEHPGIPQHFWDTSTAITITLPSPRLYKFETYFKGLNGTESRDANPWFAQYWKQHCNSTCNATNPYSTKYKFNDKLAYIIDAVYAFAHALHGMYKQLCPTMTGICPQMRPVNGTKLRDRVFNVSFKGKTGDVEFDKNGDSKGRYSLFLYSGHEAGYTFLGEWQKALNLTGNTTQLKKVKSSCDVDCKPGYSKVKREDHSCCYNCLVCPRKEHQYVNDSNCVDCGTHQRANHNHSGCVDLPDRYIPIEWVIIVSIFAGLGILSTLIVFALFLHKIDTPLVKASGRDLIFPLLIGVLLSYIMTAFLVSKPTFVICAIQRFGIGLSFSICYASILVKTNRIARIFANPNITKSANFNKPHTQLVILILLIGIEVSLVCVGLMMKPPEVIKVLPSKRDILVKCNITDYDYAITFAYNFFLVILCTVYSFRARKIPSCFNEAKYFGFVMYTTCVIWIAFLPVYYGTAKSYQPIALSLTATLNATTILVCLFGPKVYIIIFRPNRNTQNELSKTISRSVIDLSLSIPGNLGSTTNVQTSTIGIADSLNANSMQTTSRNKQILNVDSSDGMSGCSNSDATPTQVENCEDDNSRDSVATQ